MMALGSAMAGYWTRNDKMAAEVECASQFSGEQVWRLPMAEADYGDEIKSKLADLRNMGTNRMGGAIHAALFLQHFVRPHVPFCHVDIAGPAMNLKSNEGTGWGTKLITEWVLLQEQQQQQQQQQQK
jgi:leucyl aminopeptidase